MLGNLLETFRYVLVVVVFSANANAQNINQQLKLHVIDSDSIALQDVNVIINNSKSIRTDRIVKNKRVTRRRVTLLF